MSYNGHPSRAHWNVALWINNDYGTYRAACDMLHRHSTVLEASREFVEWAQEAYPRGETPDGYKFTLTLVRYALAQLRRDEPSLKP